jgi:hypothetical protein
MSINGDIMGKTMISRYAKIFLITAILSVLMFSLACLPTAYATKGRTIVNNSSETGLGIYNTTNLPVTTSTIPGSNQTTVNTTIATTSVLPTTTIPVPTTTVPIVATTVPQTAQANGGSSTIYLIAAIVIIIIIVLVAWVMMRGKK